MESIYKLEMAIRKIKNELEINVVWISWNGSRRN